MNFGEIRKNPALFLLGLWFFLSALAACATLAKVTGMIPDSFESKKKYSQSVRIKVTGGQDDEAVGRPQIPNAAFEQALATSIRRSQIFSKVVGDQTEAEDFILVVTLFSIDKRLLGTRFG